MIKAIKIYNRFQMENICINHDIKSLYHEKPWDLVSIYADEPELLTEANKDILRSMGCRKFLPLNFGDITETQYARTKLTHPEMLLFTEEQAQLVVDFIKGINEQEEDSILLAHCSAGISRSGAVGTFACDYCNLDYNEFMKQNPYIKSNAYVLSLLKRKAGMVPSFEWHDGIDHAVYKGIITF